MTSKIKNSKLNKTLAINSSTQESTFNFSSRRSTSISQNKDLLIDLNENKTSPSILIQTFKQNLSMNKRNSPRRKVIEQIPKDDNINQQPSPMMEELLLEENINLKEHNDFLVAQIQTMFERQKKYKKSCLFSCQTIKKLENINQYLQSQIHYLTQTFLSEITRIQSKLSINGSFQEDLALFSSASSESIGFKVSTFLDQNLVLLKQKINDILISKNTTVLTNQCDTCNMLDEQEAKDEKNVPFQSFFSRDKSTTADKKVSQQIFKQSKNILQGRQPEMKFMLKSLQAKQSLVTLGRQAGKHRK